jgi:hypothetical protein
MVRGKFNVDPDIMSGSKTCKKRKSPMDRKIRKLEGKSDGFIWKPDVWKVISMDLAEIQLGLIPKLNIPLFK